MEKLERFIPWAKKRLTFQKSRDVYDAAKYDSIHNAHLKLNGLEELYILSKELADASFRTNTVRTQFQSSELAPPLPGACWVNS